MSAWVVMPRGRVAEIGWATADGDETQQAEPGARRPPLTPTRTGTP
ncbi:hypothetical protein ABZ770_33120 [Streptomyces sp. NPDC006654]